MLSTTYGLPKNTVHILLPGLDSEAGESSRTSASSRPAAAIFSPDRSTHRRKTHAETAAGDHKMPDNLALGRVA
jgi:hypothetical protein